MTLAEAIGWSAHDVTWTARTSHDGKEETLGSATTHKARIELEKFPTRDDRSGREVTARGRCVIEMTTVPGGADVLTLPTGFEPLVPPVLRIIPERDEDGNVDFVEVHFG